MARYPETESQVSFHVLLLLYASAIALGCGVTCALLASRSILRQDGDWSLVWAATGFVWAVVAWVLWQVARG